jgi:hypothetical protein
MLRVAYTESGLHLECLNQSVEEWIALRAVLSLRTGQRLILEHGRASILLPVSLSNLPTLKAILQPNDVETVTLSLCDEEFIEVSLPGTWITTHVDASEGTFIANLSPGVELALLQLWQDSQTCRFPLWR